MMRTIALVAAFALYVSKVTGEGVPLGMPVAPATTYEVYDAILADQITRNPVMLYTGSYCANSRASKTMFNTYYPSLRYSYIDYDTVAGGDWLMGSSVRKSGSKKLPQVYICGQYIGGRPALFAMKDNGQLDKWLQYCANYKAK